MLADALCISVTWVGLGSTRTISDPFTFHIRIAIVTFLTCATFVTSNSVDTFWARRTRRWDSTFVNICAHLGLKKLLRVKKKSNTGCFYCIVMKRLVWKDDMSHILFTKKQSQECLKVSLGCFKSYLFRHCMFLPCSHHHSTSVTKWAGSTFIPVHHVGTFHPSEAWIVLTLRNRKQNNLVITWYSEIAREAGLSMHVIVLHSGPTSLRSVQFFPSPSIPNGHFPHWYPGLWSGVSTHDTPW
jgi:hypothetical protein